MKYVALLRGISPMNTAMRNENLRRVIEELGFDNAQSVITSGNIVFETDRTDVAAFEAEIETAWPAKLGFESMTIVRSQADLQQLVDTAPFGDLKHSVDTYLTVTFFKQPVKLDFTFPYQPDGKTYTLLSLHDRAVCSVVNTGTGTGATPDYMAWIEKQVGKDVTTRTWRTVQQILRKMTD